MTVAMRGNPPAGGEATTDGQPGGDGVQSPNQTPPSQLQDQQATGSGESVPEENNELQEGEEPPFPHDELARLDDMINKPRWVVPVLPKGELEVLLEATIDLCRRNLDGRSEACQRFFRDGLTISFTKILTDEAVSGWKFEIQRSIMKNTDLLIELCVAKLADDWFPLLDLLAIALNPLCKFHIYNGTRTPESVPSGAQINNNDLYARHTDSRTPKGWLVDLVNKFGSLNGFDVLANRFASDRSLSVSVIHAYLKPWGQCYEILTPNTIQKYFMVIVDRVINFLDSLSDEELKKESKNEAKNDALSSIIKSLKNLVARVPDTEEKIKTLEMFRLKMILRLLQISSFNGKMNALNEINKVISNVSYYTHKHSTVEEEEWLTAERVAEWIQENKVLSIVLRDSLHQPQYVEKLEKILRFVIKEKTLTLEDLDNIWAAQVGKHEAIVKNVHDLLAKLAWDFSPEQLDHLFICFQESWANATTKQREKLLELIRRLAEDDKDGVMAHKVLGLLWNLAHQEDVPTDIMDQALNAHIKILDYSCSQDRDAQKIRWIDRFVEELKNDKWVLPALKQIKEICCLFGEAPQNHSHSQRSPHMQYRHDIISMLQTKHSLVTIVAENLSQYMNSARHMAKENAGLDPHSLLPGDRYSHVQQVQERLHFLRFLLKDGQLWLCAPQAKQIWTCLAENSVYVTDREACFKWFSKLMGEDPDLDPEINKEFFESNILRLDPGLLTENGIKCFDRFFKAVNTKEGKLTPKRRAYLIEDLELIGQQYLWRVVLFGSDEVANKAIELLKETYTNLGPKLQSSQVDIHEDFIQSCMDRLRAMYDTVQVLKKDTEEKKIQQETMRMTRVLTVLREYINEYDQDHSEERAILPMSRAHRGKHVTLMVRFPNQGRQVEDLDVWSHTNESIASVRRQILLRIKANVATTKVDLYVNGELLDPVEDRRLVGQLALRDKTLVTAKLCQVGSNMPSSPDSSSDSSVGSPHQGFDGPNIETENCLPGVILSTKRQAVQFFFQLADLGCYLKVPLLRDGARALLKIIPADTNTVDKLRALCLDHAKLGQQSLSPSLDSLFFGSSQSEVLYHLEVVYSLLMPAQLPHGEDAYEFQYNFLKSGGVGCVLNMLTKNNFLPNADTETRRTALLMVLKVGKLMLTTLGYAKITAVAESLQQDMTGQSSTQTTPAAHNQALVLQQALQGIPNPNSECVLRNIAIRLGRHVADEASSHMPDLNVVKAIKKIAWSSGCGCLHLLHSSNEDIHKAYEKGVVKLPELEDVSLTKESLEVLTICLALCPPALEALNKDKSWQHFIIDLLLLSKNRTVRLSASEQFNLIATKCSSAHVPLHFFITLCFTVLQNTVKENPRSCNEYFQLLCRLLNYACTTNVTLNAAETRLTNEIEWLKTVRDDLIKSGELSVEGSLLEGHLGICKELLTFMSSEKKHQIGSKKDGCTLIQELIDDFLFPASKIVVQTRKANDDFPLCPVIPVCNSPPTTIAAFDLLVALCVGCIPNLKMVCDMLTNMYYSGTELPLCEWEYLPPVGPRPIRGFVGLKNAGATCYMNSVLQQIFMVPEIRKTILSAEGAAVDVDDDGSGDEKQDSEVNIDCKHDGGGDEKLVSSKESERKEYNMGVLKQVQYVFGHLAESKLQYYVPRGFWKIYKLWGEPVNLREQHDALEFFNSLVDSLDEALKSLGQPPIFTKVMGGSFADQKICKDCPHRYSREESFTALNVDIRNQQNLLDSLEQYVKGDLLEGPNAYHCEKCNKKVDTVKRLCIKKLPNILAIQLKRFDYDWERECAIKFNDYFEFPREFDMEPYTAAGLAKIEGEEIHDDREESSDECEESSRSTFYRLVGVVVHSGQASGGHYYSYIVNRHGDDPAKWYKFDDGEVSECRMDDDDEMRNQCFGGDYMGEVFDHMLKRTSYRRQKRWWNAYILFYERFDVKESIEKELSKGMDDLRLTTREPVNMPAIIQRCVRRQNIHFMHNRMQFSHEYFQFIRRLVTCNNPYFPGLQGQERPTQDYEELAMLSIQLVSKFLFTVGFHTKKTLRGSANEWYEALCMLMRTSKSVRTWFAQNVLFTYPARFSEYLLESPSTEVRNAFAKLLVILSHFSQQDGPFILPGTITTGDVREKPKSLSDHLLHAILCLLNKEVSEHGRHLTQYFHLFQMYANLGQAERTQLLELSVPSTFMLVALDEGPGPPIKYQYAELGKLYSVVSQLVRCCDISSKQQSSIPGGEPLPNPHGESSLQRPIMPLQPQVADLLFGRGGYVKKLIEDCNSSDETTKLLRFCCWENPQFSSLVLGELLWQVAYSYTYELRPYLDLLLQMLLLEDSWQTHRILNALKGIPDDRDGLFDTIQRSKNHYQKRAYQCIKCMVALFSSCAAAQSLLNSNGDLKRKWNWAVEWLGDELERRPYAGNPQYAYNNWSPPAQSNETSNGYFLERSHSARVTLSKAYELCPDEEPEEVEVGEDQESSPTEDPPSVHYQHHLHTVQSQNNQQLISAQNNQIHQQVPNNQQPYNQQHHMTNIHRHNNTINNSLNNQSRPQGSSEEQKEDDDASTVQSSNKQS